MHRITFKAIVFITGLTFMLSESMAQGFESRAYGSGIYLTESDFIKNNVTLFSETDAVNHLECSLDDVTLTRGGKKYRLGRGSFFGYYQDGMRYRYYQDNAKAFSSYGYYRIEEDAGVVVYSRTVSTPKTGSHTCYYYSDTFNSPIKRLSARALKNIPHESYLVLAKYIIIKSGKNFIPEN